MSARIYLEGGGNRTEGKARCREGFRKLLERCGLSGRRPRLVARGSRNSAFDGFNTAQSDASGAEYVALLIDSEVPYQTSRRHGSTCAGATAGRNRGARGKTRYC